MKANKITHNIVHGILNDPYINTEVTRLLSNVVQSDQVKASSILLVNNLLAAERKYLKTNLEQFLDKDNVKGTDDALLYFLKYLKVFKNRLENYYMTN